MNEAWEEFNPAYRPRLSYSSGDSKLMKPPSNACSWNDVIDKGNSAAKVVGLTKKVNDND